MQIINKYDAYTGCTIICLKEFVTNNLPVHEKSILLYSKNINKAYKKIFNNGSRRHISIGNLYDELIVFAEETFADLVNAWAVKKRNE
ncbi:MAG: hypothetical protein RBS24_00040 [Bacilli bacterium]|nr:hypothetical protein [Bacilli bacterium]